MSVVRWYAGRFAMWFARMTLALIVVLVSVIPSGFLGAWVGGVWGLVLAAVYTLVAIVAGLYVMVATGWWS